MYRQLSEPMIVVWANAFRETMGRWPRKSDGAIPGTVCETWSGVDRALRLGQLGLPGGSSLAKLLAERCGARCASYMPPLTEAQILVWADVHHLKTGAWPNTGSGRVLDVPFERWLRIDEALRYGRRGLPGDSSLARLLAEHRGVRLAKEPPLLTEEQILLWCDAFHQQHGKWPSEHSGLIPDSGGETWCAVENSLVRGRRGLPGGSSLARLLAHRRGVRNQTSVPNLDVPTILAWADSHYQRTQHWPTVDSGDIPEAPGENWSAIDVYLSRGGRGLPGGTTLARLLDAERGRRNHMDLPPLREARILDWADAHYQRTGNWPTPKSGVIPEAPEETWLRVETALRAGLRGLPGGSSLAQLLANHRHKRNIQGLPPLRIKKILVWVDAYFQCHGVWPTRNSGPILEAPGETWSAVDTALKDGLRGLPGGESLARLLDRKRGKRNRKNLPPLTVGQILLWADQHFQLSGQWPTNQPIPIPGGKGETWRTVDKVLRRGGRGLPGGSSLANLLAEHRGKRNPKNLPPLTEETIREWAKAHHQGCGSWPTKNSGPIAGTVGETWMTVNEALRCGTRGLPGGSSLARLLDLSVRAASARTDKSAV